MSKGRIRHFGVFISFLICTGVTVGVSLWQMSFQEDSILGTLRSWSNGCFAAAVFWCSFGLLILIARFDGFRAVQYLGYTFRCKWSKKQKDESSQLESYYDYIKRKKETRSDTRIVKAFLIPGLLYLAAAILLTVIFDRMKV